MKLDKLDRVFSEYIRRMNADNNGLCTCISCGAVKHWKEMDAGHFINRKHMALRYNEINVQPQCRACNRFDEGNIPAFGVALQQKYGEHIIKKLIALKHQTVKLSQYEVDIMTNFYKAELKKYD